jgi:hypothetical protein
MNSNIDNSFTYVCICVCCAEREQRERDNGQIGKRAMGRGCYVVAYAHDEEQGGATG